MEAPTKKEQLALPNLIVSVGPHIRTEESVQAIMWSVSGALLPATLMAVYYFGMRALSIILVSIVTAIISEAVTQKILKKPVTASDGSAFLTGLLVALNVPSSVPLYIPAVGSFVAIVITKQLFGGLGYNIFNPALIGRAFILISFPKQMTTYFEPVASIMSADAKTTATPLGILKEDGLARLLELFHTKTALYGDLFWGNRAGSLGETSVVALLLGAAFLLIKRYITWHIPVTFIVTVGVLTWIFGGKEGLFTGEAIIHLLSGGLILGAFFMATDYVTGPSIRSAQLIFGIGAGALTALIRLKGGYPEGVMFAILLMNCFAPLLDRRMRSRVFGKAEAKEMRK
ncbi:MAG TPA: electron transporter RnfD [Nitrospiraceae bacterium]|nr:MAG: electron transporter RnfD [Nitrospirae bacterium GWD2_57_8]HAR45120.1 electron transporter RnfD [Nitrospiraceae bacterium]HAS54389.1 electron transporter RnfD [Nitrospiraceae bacterium]